ncbi:hypothetical protein SKAU_G00386060 [Synaphobranchus kaupii]|uniref:Uncharacterized protein n=1 Tax=Synaphobranchus kaupii TaxID=118154 RepID=A0A9Q1EEM2_SYNKA|nr:hypothetical protein SKAU_G00386060 [Synaphobranchus kaupii]
MNLSQPLGKRALSSLHITHSPDLQERAQAGCGKRKVPDIWNDQQRGTMASLRPPGLMAHCRVQTAAQLGMARGEREVAGSRQRHSVSVDLTHHKP